MKWLPKNPYNLCMLRRHSRAVTKLIPGCWYSLRGGATRLIWVMKTHLGNNRLVITMGREKSVGNRNREAPTKANINIKHERHENQGRERKRNKKWERVEVHSLRSSSSSHHHHHHHQWHPPYLSLHSTKRRECGSPLRPDTVHTFSSDWHSLQEHTHANTQSTGLASNPISVTHTQYNIWF